MASTSKKPSKGKAAPPELLAAQAAVQRGDARQARVAFAALKAAHGDYAAEADAALARLGVDAGAVWVGLATVLLYGVAWLVVL